MKIIVELDTDFYSGLYQEFNEFVALAEHRSHTSFLRELYGFVRERHAYGTYRVTDETKLTMFMFNYPEFVVNISYE
jgi:hypothetical protein